MRRDVRLRRGQHGQQHVGQALGVEGGVQARVHAAQPQQHAQRRRLLRARALQLHHLAHTHYTSPTDHYTLHFRKPTNVTFPKMIIMLLTEIK